jgi:hypothetical protein
MEETLLARICRCILSGVNRKVESENPFNPPESAIANGQRLDKNAWTHFLWGFGVFGVLAPLPLFYWVYDCEPFVVWRFRDICFCAASFMLIMGWTLWLCVHVFQIRKGNIPTWAILLWALPVIFGGLCMKICYLYLDDRGVF